MNKNMKISMVIASIVTVFGLLFTSFGVQAATDGADVSGDVEEAILYMREEEKLARDVYLFLAEKWDLPLFSNIAKSEQMHMDRMLDLIEDYGLTDPVSPEQGVFTNTQLQSLYDQLIKDGSSSLADALKVGAAIEEIDILDLEKSLDGVTDTRVARIFQSLLRGSTMHLQAFTSSYEKEIGAVYTPQYMTQEQYASYRANNTAPAGMGSGIPLGQSGGMRGGRGRGAMGSGVNGMGGGTTGGTGSFFPWLNGNNQP